MILMFFDTGRHTMAEHTCWKINIVSITIARAGPQDYTTASIHQNLIVIFFISQYTDGGSVL